MQTALLSFKLSRTITSFKLALKVTLELLLNTVEATNVAEIAFHNCLLQVTCSQTIVNASHPQKSQSSFDILK